MSMKISVCCFAAVFILTSFYCIASIDCSKIRNGKFYYYTKKGHRLVNVERKDSLQTETDVQSGDLFKDKVVWTTDCHFQLFVGAFNEVKHTLIDTLLASTPLEVDILTITKDFYVCKGTVEILNKKIQLRDTLYFNK